jgi:hypothetical protein
MPRHHRAVAAVALATLSLGACATGGDASQGSVRDDVRETLLERADAPAPDIAADIADCVARGMFEGDFSEEERNDAGRAADGDDPDPELVERVQALFADCEDEAGAGEPQTSDERGGTDADADE